MLIAWFRKGNISCASSPPFRQINPLGNALICSFLYILADDLYQIRQRHHGTAYHEIEKLHFPPRPGNGGRIRSPARSPRPRLVPP